MALELGSMGEGSNDKVGDTASGVTLNEQVATSAGTALFLTVTAWRPDAAEDEVKV
jgi:hypothetical protein